MIVQSRTEVRTVTDTKNLTDTTTRALTETGSGSGIDVIQADIGGTVSFVVDLPDRTPVPPRPDPIPNPNTT